MPQSNVLSHVPQFHLPRRNAQKPVSNLAVFWAHEFLGTDLGNQSAVIDDLRMPLGSSLPLDLELHDKSPAHVEQVHDLPATRLNLRWPRSFHVLSLTCLMLQ